MALKALRLDSSFAAGTRSWTEVGFGDPDRSDAPEGVPWDPRETVPVAGTSITIRGAIDRLELDAGDQRAQVTDYKTGQPPSRPDAVRLAGGAELQRVLYALAVQHHRPDTRIRSRLVYLSEDAPRPYTLSDDDLAIALKVAVQHLNAGVSLARKGTCLPGPKDSWEPWNDLRIALPAVGEPYVKIKDAALHQAFGEFAAVWRTK